MHLAWHLPRHLPRAAELQAVAAEHGVGIYTLESGGACDLGGCAYAERTVLLGFSSLDERQIRDGIERIAAAIDVARTRTHEAIASTWSGAAAPARMPMAGGRVWMEGIR